MRVNGRHGRASTFIKRPLRFCVSPCRSRHLRFCAFARPRLPVEVWPAW
jgi:hypothetical protein